MNTGTEKSAPLTTHKPTILLTGAAEESRSGSPDPVVIYGHSFAFCFEVSLPCFYSDIGNLECGISFDGKVEVQGTIKSAQVLRRSSPIVCNSRTRRSSPPAPFSISFTLPGNVDPPFYKAEVASDCVLRVFVLRERLPQACKLHRIVFLEPSF